MTNRRLFSPGNTANEAKRPITYDLCRGSAGSVGAVGRQHLCSSHWPWPLLTFAKGTFQQNENYRRYFLSNSNPSSGYTKKKKILIGFFLSTDYYVYPNTHYLQTANSLLSLITNYMTMLSTYWSKFYDYFWMLFIVCIRTRSVWLCPQQITIKITFISTGYYFIELFNR